MRINRFSNYLAILIHKLTQPAMNDHNKYIVIVVLLDFPLAMDVVLMNKGRRGRECMVVGFASSNPAYGEVYSVYLTVLHI